MTMTWVQDLLPITRVEDGRLWFDHLGPIQVSTAASDLAEVGLEVTLLLARIDGIPDLKDAPGSEERTALSARWRVHACRGREPCTQCRRLRACWATNVAISLWSAGSDP